MVSTYLWYLILFVTYLHTNNMLYLILFPENIFSIIFHEHLTQKPSLFLVNNIFFITIKHSHIKELFIKKKKKRKKICNSGYLYRHLKPNLYLVPKIGKIYSKMKSNIINVKSVVYIYMKHFYVLRGRSPSKISWQFQLFRFLYGQYKFFFICLHILINKNLIPIIFLPIALIVLFIWKARLFFFLLAFRIFTGETYVPLSIC